MKKTLKSLQIKKANFDEYEIIYNKIELGKLMEYIKEDYKDGIFDYDNIKTKNGIGETIHIKGIFCSQKRNIDKFSWTEDCTYFCDASKKDYWKCHLPVYVRNTTNGTLDSPFGTDTDTLIRLTGLVNEFEKFYGIYKDLEQERFLLRGIRIRTFGRASHGVWDIQFELVEGGYSKLQYTYNERLARIVFPFEEA